MRSMAMVLPRVQRIRRKALWKGGNLSCVYHVGREERIFQEEELLKQNCMKSRDVHESGRTWALSHAAMRGECPSIFGALEQFRK